MLLVIDVGNTNTVIGIYEKNVLIKHWRIRTLENITEDEFNVLVAALFFYERIDLDKVKRTVVSCVVPSMLVILECFCRKHLGHSPHWIDIKSYKQMPILINNPEELGADRIVNSVAAYNKYMKSVIVVDFGTATTFDFISEKGEYVGGVISPGILVASEALFSKASKLPRVDIFKPPHNVLGRDTISSMKSGIIFGYAGLVDGIVKKLINEVGTHPVVLATGGLASLMISVTETIQTVEPLLTLEGLHIIDKDRQRV